jgi:hypothetical protein
MCFESVVHTRHKSVVHTRHKSAVHTRHKGAAVPSTASGSRMPRVAFQARAVCILWCTSQFDIAHHQFFE